MIRDWVLLDPWLLAFVPAVLAAVAASLAASMAFT